MAPAALGQPAETSHQIIQSIQEETRSARTLTGRNCIVPVARRGTSIKNSWPSWRPVCGIFCGSSPPSGIGSP